MAVKTWTQTSGNLWSTGANWSGGTVPVAGDSVVFDGTSTANCTADSLGTFAGAVALNAGYTGVVTQSGNVTITTLTLNAGTWTKTTQTLQCTTLTVAAATFNGGSGTITTTVSCVFNNSSGVITATSGTWNADASWTKTNSPTFNHNGGTIHFISSGTFNMSGVTFNLITSNASGTVTISNGTTVPLGNNPHLSPTTGQAFVVTGTMSGTGTLTTNGNLNISATTGVLSGFTTVQLNEAGWNATNNTSTFPNGLNFILNFVGSTGITFQGGDHTNYGSLTRIGAGGGAIQIQDTSTFTYFQDDSMAAPAHTWQFQAGETQTLTDQNPFRVMGSSGNVITITSTSGTNAILTATNGLAAIRGCDWLAVDDVTVDVAPIWYAGSNSTGDGTEVNWVFTDPPNQPKLRKSAFVIA